MLDAQAYFSFLQGRRAEVSLIGTKRLSSVVVSYLGSSTWSPFDKAGQGKAAEFMETRVVIFIRREAPSTEYSLDFGGEQDRAAAPCVLITAFWEKSSTISYFVVSFGENRKECVV